MINVKNGFPIQRHGDRQIGGRCGLPLTRHSTGDECAAVAARANRRARGPNAAEHEHALGLVAVGRPQKAVDSEEPLQREYGGQRGAVA